MSKVRGGARSVLAAGKSRRSKSGKRSADQQETNGSPAHLAVLMQAGDSATKQNMAENLQSRVGNAAMQRLVAQRLVAQRQPIGGTDTRVPIAAGPGRRSPIAAGPGPRIPIAAGPGPRIPIASGPQPSKQPPVIPIEQRIAEKFAKLRGHEFVSSPPAVTAADKQLVEESNDYFHSTPLEPWERSSGEHLKNRNKLTAVFEQKAHQLTLFILSQSEQQAWGEALRYRGDPGQDNEAATQLREAATHLANVQMELIEIAMADSEVREVRRTGYVLNAPETMDEDLDRLEKEQQNPSAPQNDGMDEAVKAHRDALVTTGKRYRALREVYGQRFPVLLPKNQDYKKISELPVGALDKYAAGRASKVLTAVHEFREEFTPAKIWSLPVVIDQTKKLMDIEEGTGANDAIESKRDDITWDAMVEKLGMAALQLGLTVVAATLTGGTSLLAQAAAATVAGGVTAISGMQVAESYQDYKFGTAAAGEISMNPAVRLASEAPGWGWLAFDVAMMVIDVAEVYTAVRAMRSIMQVAEASGGLKLLGTAATAGDAAIDAVAKTTMSLAEVEEVVRAQATVLKQEGKLAPGLTEDLFVERIMNGLRRKAATTAESVAEQQGTVLARVILKTHPQYQALLRGDRDALTLLLTQHGEWKSLVMGLERSGQTDIAKHLVAHRSDVVTELKVELEMLAKEGKPLEVKELGGASTEAISDIDLQVSGLDAGKGLVAAENIMTIRFGPTWSEMFRMNFYTDANRLARYQDVLSDLKPVEKVRLTKRISTQVEKHTFARMLRNAGSDQAAVTRIESRAQRSGFDLESVRDLAKADQTIDTAKRNQLLSELDDLNTEYATAKGTRRIELAEQISTKQIEANFYTYEANIGPTALKFSGVKGLEQHEAYQAALNHLDMIEHVIHKAGGNIALAAREYELFKYIARFADQGAKAGKTFETPGLKYLRNHGEAVSKTNREIMEETAHQYVDPKPGVRSPQFYDVQAPVTNEFIYKHWDIFTKEADGLFKRFKPDVPPPDIPRPRAGRTTARLDAVDVPSPNPVSYRDQILDHTTQDRYLVVDRSNPKFSAEAHLEGDGELTLTFRTAIAGARSEVLKGEEQFERVLMHFGSKVKSIRGSWSYGDNLAAFNKAINAHAKPEEAAFQTWTGKMAAWQGDFLRATVVSMEGKPGAYTKVVIKFHR